MPRVDLETHSTDQIFKAIQSLIINQGFKYNEDISDTNQGKISNKEFKVLMTEVANTQFSNRQNLRVTGTFEIILFHNAQRDTSDLQARIMQDAENIIFELERFAPTGKYADVRQDFIHSTRFERWLTEPVKAGDDSRIKTTIVFDITYKIKNPKA